MVIEVIILIELSCLGSGWAPGAGRSQYQVYQSGNRGNNTNRVVMPGFWLGPWRGPYPVSGLPEADCTPVPAVVAIPQPCRKAIVGLKPMITMVL